MLRKRKEESERKKKRKTTSISALLIAQMQYNLFGNMQIQKSLCLVYRRDLLILSVKGGERGRDTYAPKQSKPNKSTGRHKGGPAHFICVPHSRGSVWGDFLAVSRQQ